MVKNREEAAAECVALLPPGTVEEIRFSLCYGAHHFGLGLFLRNRYGYLCVDSPAAGMDREGIGRDVYYRMLPLLFPEFKGWEEYVERLTAAPFDELNAYYYLEYGRNFLADITPEPFFILRKESPPEQEDPDVRQARYAEENVRYAIAVAERIWRFDTFAETAKQLGYSKREVNGIFKFCVRSLREKSMFVPLEILFTKNASAASVRALAERKKQLERLFSVRDAAEIRLLPAYVFGNREIVKIMVSAQGSLLRFAPDFAADGEIVAAAVASDPGAIAYAHGSLQNDREIVKTAARHCEGSLLFAYDAYKRFCDDDEIVRLALAANGANICLASERFRADREMAVFALTHQKKWYPQSVYPSLSADLRGCKDLAMLELQAPEPSLDGFSETLLDDDDIAMELIRNGETAWMILQMSDRIKQVYAERLPSSVRELL